jgi:hypothetical protein
VYLYKSEKTRVKKLIPPLFYGKLIMGMCVRKIGIILTFLAALGFLAGCGDMDAILPSAETYKVNAKINGIPLDEFSFVSWGDKIQPYFEDSIYGDPDITGLVVYLRNTLDMTLGYRVSYNLEKSGKDEFEEEEPEAEEEKDKEKDKEPADAAAENDKDSEDKKTPAAAVKDPLLNIEQYRTGNEYNIPVKDLDKALPYFPIPPGLPIGKYTMVSQVMSKNTIISKTEKTFYYLSDADFSFDGIQVHLPGIIASPQLIPKGSVIMLEPKLEYDSRLDPYVVWYNGKRIIGEGRFSGGESNLLWRAPDQSGFFSLRAEVFPFASKQDMSSFSELMGYQKGISLLVSAKPVEIHFLPEDIPNLIHWYLFEAALGDTLAPDSVESELSPLGENTLQWMPANGTYGLAAGPDDVYMMPAVNFSKEKDESWQIVSRFKPLGEGDILSVQFDSSGTMIILSKKGNKLILTLTTGSGKVSEEYALPPLASDETEIFISTAINLSLQEGRLFVNLKLINDPVYKKEQAAVMLSPEEKYIGLRTQVDKEFKISLGYKPKRTTDADAEPVFTALWEELALISIPTEKIEVEEEDDVDFVEDEPESTDEQKISGENHEPLV